MKMMKITDKRLEWHLSMPVCETLSGVIAHINHLDIPEVVALVSRFDCDNVVELSQALWTLIKDRKKRRQVLWATAKDRKKGCLNAQ